MTRDNRTDNPLGCREASAGGVAGADPEPRDAQPRVFLLPMQAYAAERLLWVRPCHLSIRPSASPWGTSALRVAGLACGLRFEKPSRGLKVGRLESLAKLHVNRVHRIESILDATLSVALHWRRLQRQSGEFGRGGNRTDRRKSLMKYGARTTIEPAFPLVCPAFCRAMARFCAGAIPFRRGHDR